MTGCAALDCVRPAEVTVWWWLECAEPVRLYDYSHECREHGAESMRNEYPHMGFGVAARCVFAGVRDVQI